MKADEVRQKYLDFFVSKNHQVIPAAPLVPQDDPTTLFTSSGMQPLVPYLLGETHPKGKRLVNSQPSIRVQDIEEVGDNRHTTFFEMLGNWSLGDYFKEEQLPWVWEFLTKELNLPKDKLWVTVFNGDSKVPKDTESINIWKKLGVHETRIHQYGVDQNWWSRSGTPEQMPIGEIGGPDSEVFYEFSQVKHDPKFGETCHPNCDCGRFLEIANSVFIQYKKNKHNSLEELSQQNVDFGGGLERLVAASLDSPDVFTTDLFIPIIKVLETKTGKDYNTHSFDMRRIADHIKGAVIIGSEGVSPSNKEQGYIMRRLIRRSLINFRQLGVNHVNAALISQLAQSIAEIYQNSYPHIKQDVDQVTKTITQEAQGFDAAINRGIKKLKTLTKIDGKAAFDLFQSYGLPLEIIQELAAGMDKTIDQKRFEQEFQHHQEISRAGSKKKFSGGLADKSESTIKLHTATHLLHQSLRTVLGDHIQQTGSNITGERLRFDFKHPQKLVDSELKKVESLINRKIKQDLPVHKTIEDKTKALKSGARAFFNEKYPDQVSVYTIGKDPQSDWFSKELCGGPHVTSTGEIGTVKIIKEQSVGGGIRRIYAILVKK